VISLAALAAALAVWLWVRPARRHRRTVSGLSRGALARLVGAALGVVMAVVLGGVIGIVLGIVVAVAAPGALMRLESREQRHRREMLQRQAPAAADLMAACLAAGATPVDSVRAVSHALGEPIAGPLDRLTGALGLGADPAGAWAALAADASLRPIARAAARSAETGAPLAALLASVADDQRDESRARAEALARASGVRSVAPLAACFLPAFLLIGIVPVVASLALPFLQ
jgi:Flp pilus assembly protein TadB